MTGRGSHGDHLRHLRTTVSAAYAASVAGVRPEDFLAVARSLGLQPDDDRLPRDQTRRILGRLLAMTEDPTRADRIRTAIYKLGDDGPYGLV